MHIITKSACRRMWALVDDAHLSQLFLRKREGSFSHANFQHLERTVSQASTRVNHCMRGHHAVHAVSVCRVSVRIRSAHRCAGSTHCKCKFHHSIPFSHGICTLLLAGRMVGWWTSSRPPHVHGARTHEHYRVHLCFHKWKLRFEAQGSDSTLNMVKITIINTKLSLALVTNRQNLLQAERDSFTCRVMNSWVTSENTAFQLRHPLMGPTMLLGNPPGSTPNAIDAITTTTTLAIFRNLTTCLKNRTELLARETPVCLHVTCTAAVSLALRVKTRQESRCSTVMNRPTGLCITELVNGACENDGVHTRVLARGGR